MLGRRHFGLKALPHGGDGGKAPTRELFDTLLYWNAKVAVDAEGRLYVASNPGIQVFSSAGEALGIIPLPKQPQNLAFAGPDKKYLYVVGRGAAYRIPVLTAGYAGRAK